MLAVPTALPEDQQHENTKHQDPHKAGVLSQQPAPQSLPPATDPSQQPLPPYPPAPLSLPNAKPAPPVFEPEANELPTPGPRAYAKRVPASQDAAARATLSSLVSRESESDPAAANDAFPSLSLRAMASLSPSGIVRSDYAQLGPAQVVARLPPAQWLATADGGLQVQLPVHAVTRLTFRCAKTGCKRTEWVEARLLRLAFKKDPSGRADGGTIEAYSEQQWPAIFEVLPPHWSAEHGKRRLIGVALTKVGENWSLKGNNRPLSQWLFNAGEAGAPKLAKLDNWAVRASLPQGRDGSKEAKNPLARGFAPVPSLRRALFGADGDAAAPPRPLVLLLPGERSITQNAHYQETKRGGGAKKRRDSPQAAKDQPKRQRAERERLGAVPTVPLMPAHAHAVAPHYPVYPSQGAPAQQQRLTVPLPPEYQYQLQQPQPQHPHPHHHHHHQAHYHAGGESALPHVGGLAPNMAAPGGLVATEHLLAQQYWSAQQQAHERPGAQAVAYQATAAPQQSLEAEEEGPLLLGDGEFPPGFLDDLNFDDLSDGGGFSIDQLDDIVRMAGEAPATPSQQQRAFSPDLTLQLPDSVPLQLPDSVPLDAGAFGVSQTTTTAAPAPDWQASSLQPQPLSLELPTAPFAQGLQQPVPQTSAPLSTAATDLITTPTTPTAAVEPGVATPVPSAVNAKDDEQEQEPATTNVAPEQAPETTNVAPEQEPETTNVAPEQAPATTNVEAEQAPATTNVEPETTNVEPETTNVAPEQEPAEEEQSAGNSGHDGAAGIEAGASVDVAPTTIDIAQPDSANPEQVAAVEDPVRQVPVAEEVARSPGANVHVHAVEDEDPGERGLSDTPPVDDPVAQPEKATDSADVVPAEDTRPPAVVAPIPPRLRKRPAAKKTASAPRSRSASPRRPVRRSSRLRQARAAKRR